MSDDLVALLTIVLFVNPTDVELSVWMGVWGCVHPISMSVLRNGIIFFAVINSTAIYASAADAITVLLFVQLLILVHWVLVLVHFLIGRCARLLCFQLFIYSKIPHLHALPRSYRFFWRLCHLWDMLPHNLKVVQLLLLCPMFLLLLGSNCIQCH